MRPGPALLLTALLAGCSVVPPVAPALPLTEALAGAPEGFARALEPRPFRFPADHGPHPEFRTEWWYIVGNLAAARRRFGYQLTFFRQALVPTAPARDSRWAIRDVWLAHFALSDLTGGTFRASERYSRPALGLAGAEAEPWRVWLHDWSLAAEPGGSPLRLTATEPGYGLELELREVKPLVPQGERGLSRKNAAPGNASYYYSLPRLSTQGTLRLGDEKFAVEGASWIDREWSTSALGEGQVGWDWFSLQLADRRDLMLYRMRRADGAADPFSTATLIGADGQAQKFTAEQFEIEVTDRWRSPHSRVVYPAGWRVRLPAAGLDLTVEPALADQELNLSVRYWEGAVRVTGGSGGVGYVELTGYEPEAPR